MTLPILEVSQFETIANIIGDTQNGLSGSIIGNILHICHIEDTKPSLSKKKRLFAAFMATYNQTHSTNHVWHFIKECFSPSRGIFSTDQYNFFVVQRK